MQVTLNPRNAYPVGTLKIERKQVSPERIQQIADAATALPVDGNLKPAEWKALAQRSGNSLSQGDLDTIQQFSLKASSYRKQVKADFKASGYKDQELKAKLADVNVYFESADRLSTAYKEVSALSAAQAAGGASFGFLATLGAYQAYSNLKQDQLQSLADKLNELDAGKSHTVFDGNKVEQAHQDELWPLKMRLLDKAVTGAQAGHPVEVDAQYYELTSPEMVGALARAAVAGNKLRVNVDAGRLLAFDPKSAPNIDEVPDKLRSLLQLHALKADVGLSAYAVDKLLGDPQDLMHRKLLRAGDEVILLGMNANAGSGENIDAGYLIEGPAAEQLGKNFARDVKNSAGASNGDVYDEAVLKKFVANPANARTRGLSAIWDCLTGPAPAGTPLAGAKNYDELNALATRYGFKLADWIDVPADQLKDRVNASFSDEEGSLPLSKFAREKFMEVLNKTMDMLRSPENMAKLNDIHPPSGESVGDMKVGIADQPTEREMHLLNQIQSAEKFIYVPAFVMTRPVAAALVARRDELREEGKELDVKVVCDSGIYPDGGTPNEYGVKFLEDHGIPCRWSLLPRSGWHDRKIHAKEMLTDKADFFGSTNFSAKGLRENWEHSGVVQFKEGDAEDQRMLDQAKAKFNELWDNYSYECNSLELGTLYNKNKTDRDKATMIENSRFKIVRDIIEGIQSFEQQSGAMVEEKAKEPAVARRIGELMKGGLDDGNATLQAVREQMGDKAWFKALDELPARQELKKLAPRIRTKVGE